MRCARITWSARGRRQSLPERQTAGEEIGMSELNERAKKRDRGLLQIDGDECKGCGLCIEACVPKLIGMGDGLNHFGYRTAFYLGAGCTGCGVCFMVCPEPGAITVFHLVKDAAIAARQPNAAMGGAAECASN